jgi:hypothetical protein
MLAIIAALWEHASADFSDYPGRVTSNHAAGDAERLVAWVREAADELEKAHGLLDEAGVPRCREEGVAMTLAARIYTLIEAARQ